MNNPAFKSEITTLQNLLRLTFGIVPIVAGADKFLNLLADWTTYLHPFIADLIGASTFMMIVGVIEIAAGILVLVRPYIGGYVVSAWLVGIALNLIFMGTFLDIAVRDMVMAIGAYVLARLSNFTVHQPS